MLTLHTVSVSPDTIAIRDAMDDKAVHLFDATSGKPLNDGKPIFPWNQFHEIFLKFVKLNWFSILWNWFYEKNSYLIISVVYTSVHNTFLTVWSEGFLNKVAPPELNISPRMYFVIHNSVVNIQNIEKYCAILILIVYANYY